ncbi:hypothetical protein [Paenibacillus antibioticophila]|uniref:hypothetical protein n=1 Tax=Paenibacillus antibioticophila TaxID=1274374 RepID=UPI0005C7E7DD|nr:hypothetical protein [Paenibacillus antibioticophila]
MASNTPNLDLLKKDPVTDGNDTFNIETMLNENWDKIDAAVGQLEEDMQEIDIPLSDATNGTRSNVAGSEKAVGLVMQSANAANLAAGAAQTKADQAFQLGNERKAEVVAALVALGVSASTSDSWDTLISKMATVIRATGNATAADVLAGKTFSNANGNGLQGAMPNQGAGGTVTPGTANQTKPAGYYSSPITVLGDADLVPKNIRSGVDIFGVVGTLDPGFTASVFVDVTINYLYREDENTYKNVITFPKGTKWFRFVADMSGDNKNQVRRKIGRDGWSIFESQIQLVVGTNIHVLARSGDATFPSYNEDRYGYLNHTRSYCSDTELVSILFDYYLNSHKPNFIPTSGYDGDVTLRLLGINAMTRTNKVTISEPVVNMRGTIYYGG